jgi:hypothetical protein
MLDTGRKVLELEMFVSERCLANPMDTMVNLGHSQRRNMGGHKMEANEPQPSDHMMEFDFLGRQPQWHRYEDILL